MNSDYIVSLALNQTLALPFSVDSHAWLGGSLLLRMSWRRGDDVSVPWSVLRSDPLEERDEDAPEITLLDPPVGASVPDPIAVRARGEDEEF